MASGGIRPKLLWQSSLCKQFLFPLLPSFVFLPILLFLPIPVTPPFSASQETIHSFFFTQIGIFWITFPLVDLSSYIVLLTIWYIKWSIVHLNDLWMAAVSAALLLEIVLKLANMFLLCNKFLYKEHSEWQKSLMVVLYCSWMEL